MNIDPGQRIAAWLTAHQTLSAALALGLLLNLCFFPFIWGDRTLLASSRITPNVPSIIPNGAFFGPQQGPSIRRANDDGAAAWVLEADAPLVRQQYLAEKNLPLWNPYESYGAPLAANMQSQPFNPLYVLFALHPTPRSFNLFVLFRLFLAGFCAYLYLRLFLTFAPALAGGIVCMLSGYYLLFFNMPHISVDMLVPAVFLAIERLLRRCSPGNFLLSVAIVFLSISGGMPESTLLALTFGYCYFLFRILTDPALRLQARKHVIRFILANVLGFAICAFLLAPFVEFMRVSSDTHQSHNISGVPIWGVRHDNIGPSISTYVTPLIFGTAWSPISPSLGGYTALRGFFGILPILFGIVAGAGLFRDHEQFPGEKRLTLYFLAAVLLIICKRYGAPLVNAIGDLPFFRLVQFVKYEESLLVFAVSVISAIGVSEALIRRDRRHLVLSVSLAFVVLAAILAFTLPAFRATKVVPNIYYLSLAAAAAVLFLAALVLLSPNLQATRNGPAVAIVILLAAEMSGNYIVPVYYLLTSSASVDADPYRGAPYIDYLKSKLSSHERVFASDGILHPGWAGTFQISDIRGLDAMYWRKYFPFLRAFLSDIALPPADRRLRDRFTGFDINADETRLKTRLMQLSSVRYRASMQPVEPASAFIEDILAQTKGKLTKGRENLIEQRRFTIGGETKPVLYEHPAYDRLPLTLDITPARRLLSFDVAIQPAVYDGTIPLCGDGVEFRLEVRDGHGQIELLYSRYIDPKHILSERRWIPETVDLNRYVGQKVELLFSTTPGPAGDTCADWAGWGDPHFPLEGDRRTGARLVYDHEVKIYEYDKALPRASLFSQVEVVPNEQAVLSRLVDPSLDIFQTAVVSASDLDAESAVNLQSINATSAGPVQAAAITSYTSQDVEIEASTGRPVMLMLNDTDYPGWQVYVDGGRSQWITVDYLFRGVPLSGGRHKVRFVYQPASFRFGAIASVAALLITILLVRVWALSRPDRTGPRPSPAELPV
jgi:hypothetical protein